MGVFNAPVKLELAGKQESIDTKTLCPDCEEPTKMDWQGYTCPSCGKNINHWSQGDRGFEYEKAVEDECPNCGTEIDTEKYKKCPECDEEIPESTTEHVRVTEEERNALKAERESTIELFGFVPEDSVEFPRLSTSKPYHVIPQEEGEKQYAILAETLEDKVGIGKVVFGSKEHLVGIREVDGKLVANRLYYDDEIREPSPFKLPDVSQKEREAAQEMVESNTIEPDWGEYEDEYRSSLEDLIGKRLQGEEVEIETPEEPEEESDVSVVEAMEAAAEA